jgi:hypothetical protein
MGNGDTLILNKSNEIWLHQLSLAAAQHIDEVYRISTFSYGWNVLYEPWTIKENYGREAVSPEQIAIWKRVRICVPG